MKVTFGCHWLVQKSKVIPAARPRLIAWVELITESEWAVIECKTTSRAIVTIKISLAVADADPVGYKRRKAATELACEQHHFFGSV